MHTSNFLVMERDDARADSIVSALQFLGYHPHRWDASLVADSVAHDWRAVYIGTVVDQADCRAALAAVQEQNDQVVLLVSNDSPQAAWLAGPSSGHAGHMEMLEFPLRYERLAEAMRGLHARQLGAVPGNQRLVGNSVAMGKVNALIRQVAPFDSNVLVLGESGTGKEMVARSVHDCSPRRDKPFIAVNCGAIPAELLESELFGHEKGSFTGAISARKGRFELAEGGTLFLDEIGDMPLALQTRLLRVLAGGEFYRVGGRELIRGNVRIVAATHQDLATRVAAGQFRADLMHRLDVVRIELPPLRMRRSDIPLLAQHFLAATAQELKLPPKRFSRAALKLIAQRDFPGNVRELENLCRRLTVIAPGTEILPADLGSVIANASGSGEWTDALREWAVDALARGDADIHARARDALDQTLLQAALLANEGHRQNAAQALGVGRNTLTRKLGASRTRRH